MANYYGFTSGAPEKKSKVTKRGKAYPTQETTQSAAYSEKETVLAVPRILPTTLWKEGFPGGSVVKNLPAKVGFKRNQSLGQVWSLGLEDPLEEDTATHSSILAWDNTLDRGTWQAIVHRIARSLKWETEHTLAHCGKICISSFIKDWKLTSFKKTHYTVTTVGVTKVRRNEKVDLGQEMSRVCLWFSLACLSSFELPLLEGTHYQQMWRWWPAHLEIKLHDSLTKYILKIPFES